MTFGTKMAWGSGETPVDNTQVTVTMTWAQARVLIALTGGISGAGQARGATDALFDALLKAGAKVTGKAVPNTTGWAEDFGMSFRVGHISIDEVG